MFNWAQKSRVNFTHTYAYSKKCVRREWTYTLIRHILFFFFILHICNKSVPQILDLYIVVRWLNFSYK